MEGGVRKFIRDLAGAGSKGQNGCLHAPDYSSLDGGD